MPIMEAIKEIRELGRTSLRMGAAYLPRRFCDAGLARWRE
jgi:hypothetical protein